VFLLASYVVGAISAGAGIALILMRRRIYRFVHGRYEKMLRAEGLTDEEIAGRIPGVGLIMLLGVGLLIVSIVFIVCGAVSARA
jgi:hypothetical protein